MTDPTPEPGYTKLQDKSSLPWYLENIDKYLQPETQDLLEKYSGIAREKQSEHVHAIRDKAWSVRAYPCTGLGIWLIPYIRYSPAYSTVLEKLKSGGSILDVGCHMGADLRRLAFDGAPTEKMYGVDIVSHWDVGYDLYHDRDKFKGKFIEADLLGEDPPALAALHGTINVISVSAVFHHWLWEKQVQAAKKLVMFSSGKGAMVVGHQVANPKAGNVELLKLHAFKQSAESWTKMWEQVGAETGTKWQVQTRMLSFNNVGWDPNDVAWMPPNDCVLDWVVTRIE